MRADTLLVVVDETTGALALDQQGAQFDALAELLGVPVTGRRPWLSAWIASYPQYHPWVFSAWDDESLVGSCLLASRPVGESIEVIALGQGRNDRTRFLAPDSIIAGVLAERIGRALHHFERPWSMRIEQLPLDDPMATALLGEIPGSFISPGGSVPGVDFTDPEAIDSYLSKNLRRQLQKCRNRITTDDVQASMTFTRVKNRLWEHLDEIEQVHRSRDHDVGRASDIDDPAGRHLWRTIVATHIERDEVEIAMLRLDGALAAYVISFLDHTTFRVFDGRCVTKWARYSPGRLLETETLRRAITDQQFDRLDWMNSIAPDKLIAANTLEPTMNLVAASTN